MTLNIVSLFSGAGGLDLGFKKEGFNIIWANEYDKTIWETFEYNFHDTALDKRSITDISFNEIPDCDGIIGGPPCQSWSEVGKFDGIKSPNGKLFNNYIQILKEKQPKFFLVENVPGLVSKAHIGEFKKFIFYFENAGYNVTWKLINSNDYGVPQERFRIIIVGFRKDLGKLFIFPDPDLYKPTLRNAIWDLPEPKKCDKYKSNTDLVIPNHEYLIETFSPIFMERNRVRSWDEPSYTILASARHIVIHPSAPKMIKHSRNKFIFADGKESLYRRFSVRECARIQTFPDEYIFKYKNIRDGYKMVGNAVPVNLAMRLANSIKEQLN